MTVEELIKELKKCDLTSEVILAKDEEGNGFSPLADIDGENCVYSPNSTWSGEIFDARWTPEEACLSKEQHSEMFKKKRSVFLWPTN